MKTRSQLITTALVVFLSSATNALAQGWTNGQNGYAGQRPVLSGREDGASMYVCRAEHHGQTIPGKLHVGNGKCYVALNGQEAGYSEYEVLQRFDPQDFASGPIPKMRWKSRTSIAFDDSCLESTNVAERFRDDLVRASDSEGGLHVCRSREGIAGKLVGGPRLGTCYYGWHGAEERTGDFQVLCIKRPRR